MMRNSWKASFCKALRPLETQKVISRAMHIPFSLQVSLKNLDRGWASSGLDIFDNGGVDSWSRTEQHSWHASFLKTSTLLTFAVDLLKDAGCRFLFICHLIGCVTTCLDSPLPENHRKGAVGLAMTSRAVTFLQFPVWTTENSSILWVAWVLLSGDRLVMLLLLPLPGLWLRCRVVLVPIGLTTGILKCTTGAQKASSCPLGVVSLN